MSAPRKIAALNAPDHQTAKTSTFVEVLEVLTLAGNKQHLEDTETLNYYGSLEGIVSFPKTAQTSVKTLFFTQ